MHIVNGLGKNLFKLVSSFIYLFYLSLEKRQLFIEIRLHYWQLFLFIYISPLLCLTTDLFVFISNFNTNMSFSCIVRKLNVSVKIQYFI